MRYPHLIDTTEHEDTLPVYCIAPGFDWDDLTDEEKLRYVRELEYQVAKYAKYVEDLESIIAELKAEMG